MNGWRENAARKWATLAEAIYQGISHFCMLFIDHFSVAPARKVAIVLQFVR